MARWHGDLFPVLEELGIGFVAFSPLANGFVSGKYGKDTVLEAGTDYRSVMPQFTKDGIDRNWDLPELLNKIAKEKYAIPAQISQAWMYPLPVLIVATYDIGELMRLLAVFYIKLPYALL